MPPAPSRRTRLGRALLTSTLVASGLVTSASPQRAAAAGAEHPIVLAGNFTGDNSPDLFFHSPSSAPDVLYDFNGSVDGGTIDVTTYDVRGTFRPFVGDFTGSGQIDDIFWYQPGAGSDMIWDFANTETPTHRSMPVTVNGTYKPVVGRFLGGGLPGDPDDVFWYGPGSVPDSIWAFARPACSTCAPRYTPKAMTVSGSGYQPVAGSFVQNDTTFSDIFWYNPTGPESLWDFSGPAVTDIRKLTLPVLQVAGSRYLVTSADLFEDQYDDIIFAGPGAVSDALWEFSNGYVAKTTLPEPLTDAFTSVVGVEDGNLPRPDDFLTYDPGTRRVRYYDFLADPLANSNAYLRTDLQPVP